MHAYDYATQSWISGDAARRLLITQARQTLALIDSPRGAEYARSVGRCLSDMRTECIESLRELAA